MSYTARQSVTCAALWNLQCPCRGVQRPQLGIQCNRLAQSSFSLNWTPEQRRVSQLVQARLKRRLEHAHCLGMRWLSRTARVERIYTSSEAAMLPNHHSSFKRLTSSAGGSLCAVFARIVGHLFVWRLFVPQHFAQTPRICEKIRSFCLYLCDTCGGPGTVSPRCGTHPGPGHHRP